MSFNNKIFSLKNSIYLFSVLIFSQITFSNCNNTGSSQEESCKELPQASNQKVEIEIIRLEKALLKKEKNWKEMQKFLEEDFEEVGKKFYRHKKGDTLMPGGLLALTSNPQVKPLFDAVEKTFDEKRINDLKDEFKKAFQHLKIYYPNTKVPKIYTTVTGFGDFGGLDFYVDKDMIVVSLDFFLGEKYAPKGYRPNRNLIPDYQWKRFSPESIVMNTMIFMSNAHNATNMKDQTMIAEMIYYGKAYYFVKKMMPCVKDSILFGYSKEDLRNIADDRNRNFIWNFIIEKKALFSEKESTKKTYLGESPYIAEINKKCPGRVGRWFGWRMIKRFEEKNTDVPFEKIMQNPNAQELFEKSKYNGQ